MLLVIIHGKKDIVFNERAGTAIRAAGPFGTFSMECIRLRMHGWWYIRVQYMQYGVMYREKKRLSTRKWMRLCIRKLAKRCEETRWPIVLFLCEWVLCQFSLFSTLVFFISLFLFFKLTLGPHNKTCTGRVTMQRLFLFIFIFVFALNFEEKTSRQIYLTQV